MKLKTRRRPKFQLKLPQSCPDSGESLSQVAPTVPALAPTVPALAPTLPDSPRLSPTLPNSPRLRLTDGGRVRSGRGSRG